MKMGKWNLEKLRKEVNMDNSQFKKILETFPDNSHIEAYQGESNGFRVEDENGKYLGFIEDNGEVEYGIDGKSPD